MKKNKTIFLVVYAIIAILASLSVLMYIIDNLENQFITIMEKNSLIFQDKIVKVNDVLELEGKKANHLINSDDLEEEFEESIYSDMLSFLTYDEDQNLFHFDNIQNSNYDTTNLSNVTGKGNLDFLNDENSLKTSELYLMFLMNQDFKWLNEKLDASDWVYYTSLNQMTSMRSRNNEFVSSDEFRYRDDMLEMSFITDGYEENLENRETVYWSVPYVDLAGMGCMITASYPVDYKGEYIGALSIDFISNEISGILSEKYTTFLVDSNGVLFATNLKEVDLNQELKTVDDLPLALTFNDINNIEYDKVVNVKGDKVIAHRLEGSPYTLYQVYKQKMYLTDAAIDFFPVILIFVFFIITSLMLRKVRESEAKLKETLSELEQKQEELDYISKYDTLTNIYNRRGLYSEIKKLETKGELVGSSVILFDIDHFKQVNDTYGHDVGDEVLTELCEVVKNYISDNEIFARYGGEEFIVISRGTSLEKTCEIAEKIRVCVSSHKYKTIKGLTVSLGVSTCSQGDINNAWITNADTALYKAKSDGRNKVYYYKNYELISYNQR